MDIWIISDGEKIGPFPDYVIRGKIQKGELEREVRLWHEGLAGWTKAVDLDLFRREFDKVDLPVEPPPLPKRKSDRPKADLKKSEKEPKVPHPKAHVSRRFGARWMDLSGYGAIWWLGIYFSGRDVSATILNPWMLLSMYLPWFALEAWLIHRFGSTPGKWLMGLKVTNADGSLLSLKESVWRSMRVLVSGIGFGWQLLAPLCQLMSWFTTKRIGKPIWDYLGGHEVTAARLNPVKIGVLAVLFFVAIQLQMAVRWPHEKAIWLETYPESKEWLESDDVWTLPVKQVKED